MGIRINNLKHGAATSLHAMARFARATSANVAMSFALLSPVLMGSLGVAFETAYWYMDRRGMQNAADAAALAAATDGTSNYKATVGAVAAQYGYVNGTNNAAIESASSVACPGTGATSCYKVSIAYKQ